MRVHQYRPKSILNRAGPFVAVLCVIFIATLWLTSGSYDNFVLDGWEGVVKGVVLNSDDTGYSTGYTPQRFRSVQVGMSKPQVKERLGEPFRRCDWSYEPAVYDEAWVYSFSQSGGDYRVRGILFMRGVVSKVRSQYID